MELPRRFLALSFLFVFCNVKSIVKADVAELIQLAITYGAPFAETAIERLHGELFGKGRAARTTDIVIFNKSNKHFILGENKCKSGGFSTGLFPDDEISPKESVVFGIESNGFATGVECKVKYTTEENSIKDSHSPSLKLVPTKGQGNNNQVRWIIENN